MNIKITPAPLAGSLPAIPSKSEAHRLLICAALADAPTRITLAASSQDIKATIGCLGALGAKITGGDGEILVSPIRSAPPLPTLDCGESGATLRFLLPVAAVLCPRVRFLGSGRLPERPIGELLKAMKRHGVTFSGDRLPFETSGLLKGGEYRLPGDVSSQYITGLLLALPGAEAESGLEITTRLESAPYIDITLDVMRRFGVNVEQKGRRYRIFAPRRFVSPQAAQTGGDWSNAAFFLAAGALGGKVTVTGLDPGSRQGDKAVAGILRDFGAGVTVSGDSVTVTPGPLDGCEVDLGPVPDLLPALAPVAACARGETRFIHGARLRLKESDRLISVTAMLRALGAGVTETKNGLTVTGGGLKGGTVDSFHDHRIAMAAAVAAIRCPGPVTIINAGAVAKSYPAFFRDYQSIGGQADVI